MDGLDKVWFTLPESENLDEAFRGPPISHNVNVCTFSIIISLGLNKEPALVLL
jgi:hypothetical protein